MNETIGEHIYEYDNFSFKLFIPDYWTKIYKGQPRKRLYHDYCIMLDLVKKVDKSKWIMDVGANHGIFSVPASMLGYKVIGFEPVVSNFKNLLEAMVENNLINFEMFNLALSNEDSLRDIFVPECLDNASFSHEAAVANMKHKEYHTEKIYTAKFDDWIRDHPQFNNIGFIKIDVQGAEYKVIEGMNYFLSNASDIYLIAEYEPHLQKMGYSYEQLDEIIMSHGFSLVNKMGNDKLFYKR